jgi:tetratricopeptide (TPR) repeat protein
MRTRLPKVSDEAIAQLSAAVAGSPGDVVPLMMRGAYYLKNLDAEHAIADFTAVIKIDPRRVWAYTQRGVAYRSLEKFDKSFADFALARKINPFSTDAALESARLHKTLHQYPQAIAVYDELVRSRPDSSLVLLERCQTYLDSKKPDSALADADKLVSMKRDFAKLKIRADALTACGKYKEAIIPVPWSSSLVARRLCRGAPRLIENSVTSLMLSRTSAAYNLSTTKSSKTHRSEGRTKFRPQSVILSGWPVGFLKWQSEPEAAALALFAFYSDRSAMRIDNHLAYGKPQP